MLTIIFLQCLMMYEIVHLSVLDLHQYELKLYDGRVSLPDPKA